MKKVLLWPNPRLKLVSAAVDVEVLNQDPEAVKSLRDLVEEMAKVMGAYGGVGLAAVQINTPVRVVTSLVDGIPRVYINPQLVKTDGESRLIREGCLSLPGIVEHVRRFDTVTVKTQPLLIDGVGPEETFTAHGLLAQVLAHELEHLDGRLFVDSLPSAKRSLIRGDLLKRKKLGQLRDYR